MNNPKSILKGIVAFVIIVAIGVGIGWLASQRQKRAQKPIVQQGVTNTQTAVKPTPIAMKTATISTNVVQITEESDEEPESADLEDKIGDILGDDSELTNKVAELLELYPKLTPAGKLEAAGHLVNLVGDEPEEYAPLGKLLLDTNVPVAVAQELVDDLINRPCSLMMEMYLKIVCTPDHPGALAARENLEMYLDHDYGDNCEAWTKAMNDWLKDNPDCEE